MMQIVATLVFSGAAAVSGAVIYQSIAPQWRRIVSLAAGRPETAFTPLSQLVQTERRIAVRRWARAPVPAALRRLRAAA